MTGFYVKCIAGLKCVNPLSVGQLQSQFGFGAPKVNIFWKIRSGI